MTGDLCSVVVPTLNRRTRVIETVRTIQAQTYSPIEIVVVVDGSTDGTAEALRALRDDRIVVVENQLPTGVATARNLGVGKASGKWVAFCDDDDLWLPEKVAGQINAMEATGSRWSYSQALSIDEDGRCLTMYRPPDVDFERRTDFSQNIAFGNKVPGGCSTVLMQREFFVETGGFDESLSMFADWELWVRLAAIEEPVAWNGVGTLYLVHSQQMSLDHSNSSKELDHVRRKHTNLRRELGTRRWEGIDRWVIQRFWSAGQRRRAIKYGLIDARGDLRWLSMVLTLGGLTRDRAQRRLGLTESAEARSAIQVGLNLAAGRSQTDAAESDAL